MRDCTNIPIKITASSGIAGTSLGGSTIDWMIGIGYKLTSQTNIEAVRQRLLGIQLLVVDEISMVGCWKLLNVDTVLKIVFNNTKPFGGMDVLVVGDFAHSPQSDRSQSYIAWPIAQKITLRQHN